MFCSNFLTDQSKGAKSRKILWNARTTIFLFLQNSMLIGSQYFKVWLKSSRIS